MSELSPEAREQLARTAGAHTPVWDHNEYGFRLDCGCRRFTHFGTTREEAETRFGDHMADALAPTVASIVTAAVEAERARIVSAVEAAASEWEQRAADALIVGDLSPTVMTALMGAWGSGAQELRTALTSAAPALDADDPRPCREQNANVCVAEGCYGEACRGSRTTDETDEERDSRLMAEGPRRPGAFVAAPRRPRRPTDERGAR